MLPEFAAPSPPITTPLPAMPKDLVDRHHLAEGRVLHRRFHPKSHQFLYQSCWQWLNVDHLDTLNQLPFWASGKKALLSFRRKDYLAPCHVSLRAAITARLVESNLPAPHHVVLLTQLRSWGVHFNPVSFYFCFDNDDRLLAILAEITNTPWGERRAYLLPAAEGSQSFSASQGHCYEFRFYKDFHVSPFMPISLQYHWRFRFFEERLHIHMRLMQGENSGPDSVTESSNERLQNEDAAEQAVPPQHIFDASLALQLQPVTARAARNAAWGYPWHCVKTLSGIYWQALRLWWKGVPFHSHPDNAGTATAPRHPVDPPASRS